MWTMQVRGAGYEGTLLSAQFSCEPKTTLKINQVYLKNSRGRDINKCTYISIKYLLIYKTLVIAVIQGRGQISLSMENTAGARL